jgi:hypothetical protein
VQAAVEVPSQVPPQLEPSVVQAGRAPRGAPLTATHWPSWPGSPQDWHWPSQALWQQKPSAQTPLWHWPASPQLWPVASWAVHTPPEQNWPDGQSESTAQPPWQMEAPQPPGPHCCSKAAGQLPAPSQVAARVAMPLAQLAPRQEVSDAG